MSLLKKMFGIERINEDHLVREKNLLMRELSLHNQADASELWNNSYQDYRKKALERQEYDFKISALCYANNVLKSYIKKTK